MRRHAVANVCSQCGARVSQHESQVCSSVWSCTRTRVFAAPRRRKYAPECRNMNRTCVPPCGPARARTRVFLLAPRYSPGRRAPRRGRARLPALALRVAHVGARDVPLGRGALAARGERGRGLARPAPGRARARAGRDDGRARRRAPPRGGRAQGARRQGDRRLVRGGRQWDRREGMARRSQTDRGRDVTATERNSRRTVSRPRRATRSRRRRCGASSTRRSCCSTRSSGSRPASPPRSS